GQVLDAIGAHHRPPVGGNQADLEELPQRNQHQNAQQEWRPPRCSGEGDRASLAADELARRRAPRDTHAYNQLSRVTSARSRGLSISRTTYPNRAQPRVARSWPRSAAGT